MNVTMISDTLHRIAACILISLSMLLTGCADTANEDLESFLRNAGNDMQVKIKPLPEMKSYLSFEFNADGALNDPFKTRRDFEHSAILAPNLNRPKQPLEGFPLESLKFVGMIERGESTFGLLKTPDNSIQQIQSGQYVGQNFGKVTSIYENGIDILEVIQDDSTGDWVEQPASLLLDE